ncbi:MAG: glycoside hydrolase family 25 protein [Lachnospiraceae bacterium]|nr:glycoside hydrolase family 25 protein [Lachnospiraceae bacterium]
MKLGGNDNKISPQMGAVVVASVLIIFAIIGIAVVPQLSKQKNDVDYSNVLPEHNESINSETYNSKENADNINSGDSGVVISDNKDGITSPDELDFWDLYPENKETEGMEMVPENGAASGSGTENGPGLPPADGSAPGTGEGVSSDENDPSKDGKHTKVTLRDGSEEWVTISQYLPKNDYDYSNLVCKDDRMEYYIDGKKVSYLGIDVSKYQDYIDFNKVKKDGIDFVMIRVGLRGYGTGQITYDDYFFDNIKRATDAGLKVGVYFSSQAISKDEATEEANTVLEALGDYKIDYPIAFDMGFIDGDTARIEGLSINDKTEIAKTFLDTVSAKGYTGCIYATKEWLIKEIELSKLTSYDFWLAQEEDLPDYPYKFSMWQYKTKASVEGISGFVNLNISFVDYTEK